MLKRTTLLLLSIFTLTLIVSCDQEKEADDASKSEDAKVKEEPKKEEASTEKKEIYSQTTNGITLRETPRAPEFPDAELTLNNYVSSMKPGKVPFDFEVKNYELMAQTDGKPHCANSEKGQHIHFILNNSPYDAHYEPNFEKEIPEGKHLLVAFLSRSYHESIKNGKAFVAKQMNVGEAEDDEIDMSAPHLIYSRPKGTYSKDKGSPLLLDFYLLNTELSSEGNKVRVTIDKTEFVVPRWSPYVVEGLEPGEHTFRIELIDDAGLVVDGPFNDSGDRTITIES